MIPSDSGTPPPTSEASGTTTRRSGPWSYTAALWWSVPCSIIGLSLVGNELMAGGYAELVGFFLPGAIIAALIVGVRKAQRKPRWSYSTAVAVSVAATIAVDLLAKLNGGSDPGEFVNRLVLLLLLLPGAAIASAIVALRNQRAWGRPDSDKGMK